MSRTRQLPCEPQHAHAGVIIVYYFAVRCLPDQLIPRPV